jgi:hypothetical protein
MRPRLLTTPSDPRREPAERARRSARAGERQRAKRQHAERHGARTRPLLTPPSPAPSLPSPAGAAVYGHPRRQPHLFSEVADEQAAAGEQAVRRARVGHVDRDDLAADLDAEAQAQGPRH